MEEKMNIANILAKCSQGMRLYSPAFAEVVYDRIDSRGYIRCFVGRHKDEVTFTPTGGVNRSPAAKCVIYPWEERDWVSLECRLGKDKAQIAKAVETIITALTK